MLATLRTPCRHLNIRFGRAGYSTASALLDANHDINALVYIPKRITLGDSELAVDRAGLVEPIPIAIKDNICTKSMPTTCSSKMLRDFTPPFDATVVELLSKAGYALVGKANCDEFGMGCV